MGGTASRSPVGGGPKRRPSTPSPGSRAPARAARCAASEDCSPRTGACAPRRPRPPDGSAPPRIAAACRNPAAFRRVSADTRNPLWRWPRALRDTPGFHKILGGQVVERIGTRGPRTEQPAQRNRLYSSNAHALPEHRIESAHRISQRDEAAWEAIGAVEMAPDACRKVVTDDVADRLCGPDGLGPVFS
jgi:hypothetical protein